LRNHINNKFGVNINQQINSGLILRGYTPPVIEARSDRLAALATNENVDRNLFQAIRNHKPDGYIVAVGSGMSLSLPLGFNHKNSSKFYFGVKPCKMIA